jgi:hypothetical protein
MHFQLLLPGELDTHFATLITKHYILCYIETNHYVLYYIDNQPLYTYVAELVTTHVLLFSPAEHVVINAAK